MVTKLVITVGDTKLQLTIDEATELWKELNKLFGTKWSTSPFPMYKIPPVTCQARDDYFGL